VSDSEYSYEGFKKPRLDKRKDGSKTEGERKKEERSMRRKEP
jgi:hypothetical protein